MTSTVTPTPASPTTRPVVRRDARRLHLPKRGRRALLVAHVLSSVAAVSGLTGLVLVLGTPWGVATHWWVVLKEVAFIPLVVTDFLVIAPSAHDLARGGSGGFLEPAIAHCVLLALATVVSIVKPFGKTPHGRRRLPSRG